MPDSGERPPKPVRRLLGATWSNAGPAVALLASIVALAFTLVPRWAPDPGVVLGATVSVQSVDQNVSYYTYEAEFDPNGLKRFSPQERQGFHTQRGAVVYVRAKVQGKKHGHVTLDYVNYAWASRRPIGPPGPPVGFLADTTSDQWVVPVFVTPPDPPPQDYLVRVRVFDRAALLAYVDTGRIKPPPTP